MMTEVNGVLKVRAARGRFLIRLERFRLRMTIVMSHSVSVAAHFHCPGRKRKKLLVGRVLIEGLNIQSLEFPSDLISLKEKQILTKRSHSSTSFSASDGFDSPRQKLPAIAPPVKVFTIVNKCFFRHFLMRYHFTLS